jgi:hypothetical protein
MKYGQPFLTRSRHVRIPGRPTPWTGGRHASQLRSDAMIVTQHPAEALNAFERAESRVLLIAEKWDYSAKRRDSGRPPVMKEITDLTVRIAREAPSSSGGDHAQSEHGVDDAEGTQPDCPRRRTRWQAVHHHGSQ